MEILGIFFIFGEGNYTVKDLDFLGNGSRKNFKRLKPKL